MKLRMRYGTRLVFGAGVIKLKWHKTTCCLRLNLPFLCSVISHIKAVALHNWGEQWNHLSIAHRLTADYAFYHYCNRTLIVYCIENVVTCFFSGTHSALELSYFMRYINSYLLICFVSQNNQTKLLHCLPGRMPSACRSCVCMVWMIKTASSVTAWTGVLAIAVCVTELMKPFSAVTRVPRPPLPPLPPPSEPQVSRILSLLSSIRWQYVAYWYWCCSSFWLS